MASITKYHLPQVLGLNHNVKTTESKFVPMGKTYFRLPNIHHVWLWNIVRFWALSTPLALLPPTPFVTLENYCHDHNYYCHVALTLLLSCVCAQHVTKLDAVHELPLCSNCSKFCLEVALSWYELEI